SMTLAAEAMSSAIVSVRYTRSQAVCSVVPMAGIVRRFYSESPWDSFFRDSGLVKDSSGLAFTRGQNGRFPLTHPWSRDSRKELQLQAVPGVSGFCGSPCDALRAVLQRRQVE